MLVPVTSPQWTSVWQTTTKEKFLWKWLKTPEKCLLKKFSQVVFLWIFSSAQTLNIFQTIGSNFRWKYFAHFTKSGLGFHSITFVSGAARIMLLLNPKIGSLQDLIFYLVAFSRLWLSKYQLTIQQGGAQLWAQCTDTQADHALKVAIVPTLY